jgi:hypothetical protein
MEGKVTGEELVDLKRARSTTLAQACDWMLDDKLYGNTVAPFDGTRFRVTHHPLGERDQGA